MTEIDTHGLDLDYIRSLRNKALEALSWSNRTRSRWAPELRHILEAKTQEEFDIAVADAEKRAIELAREKLSEFDLARLREDIEHHVGEEAPQGLDAKGLCDWLAAECDGMKLWHAENWHRDGFTEHEGVVTAYASTMSLRRFGYGGFVEKTL